MKPDQIEIGKTYRMRGDSYLHVLIPRSGGSNDACTMFVERAAMSDLFPGEHRKKQGAA